jgi:hypothetical protein
MAASFAIRQPEMILARSCAAVLLRKTEREPPHARAPMCSHLPYEKGYPHPRQPDCTLDRSQRTVKHENPEKFDAFVNAAEAT